MAASTKATEITIQEVKTERTIITLMGTSPLICNRMSEKARHQLLLPSGPMSQAAKRSSLKHSPIDEFRASPYTLADPSAPTMIALMSSAFKGAMRTAALDLPGAAKAQIGRLVYVEGDYVPIYGEPQLLMSVTRSADINHTPDIRSRVIIPQWGCQVAIKFVTPLLNLQSIVNLLAAAGMTAGVGDWRPEKGKGDYGQFRIANGDPRFEELRSQGRAVQMSAMANPVAYDAETAEMLSWYDEEVNRRGVKQVIKEDENESDGEDEAA